VSSDEPSPIVVAHSFLTTLQCYTLVRSKQTVTAFTDIALAGTGDDPEKVKKDKMLVAQAFPDGNAPKYATVMLDPEACGKLQVSRARAIEFPFLTVRGRFYGSYSRTGKPKHRKRTKS
jgi:hypothetical protein